jgi:hypothetical protein
MSLPSRIEEATEEGLRRGGVELRPDDIEQKFETLDTTHFHVEWTEKEDDIVYHFWPPGDSSRFLDGFENRLEEAFKHVLPPDQEVIADYTNLEEATVQHTHGVGMVPKKDMEKAIVIPRENYYVRVVSGLKNPLADIFLKGRVFKRLEEEIREHS